MRLRASHLAPIVVPPCALRLLRACLPQRGGAWYEAPFSSRRNIALSLLGGAAALWLFEHSEWLQRGFQRSASCTAMHMRALRK